MPFRRRPPNRLFYAAQRQHTHPYRPAPPMITDLPAFSSAAVPARPPYDPDTYYECDGGMVPMRRNEKDAPVMSQAADQSAPQPQALDQQSPQPQPLSFSQDEAMVNGTLFPGLFTPVRRSWR